MKIQSVTARLSVKCENHIYHNKLGKEVAIFESSRNRNRLVLQKALPQMFAATLQFPAPDLYHYYHILQFAADSVRYKIVWSDRPFDIFPVRMLDRRYKLP